MIQKLSPPARITLMYVLFSAGWIVSSGIALSGLHIGLGLEHIVEVLKGLLFVVVTSSFLYWLLKRFHFEQIASINKLREASSALQNSEQHLRLSQIGGGIGTWEADLINNRQTWSENCTSLLGFPHNSNPTWEDFLAVVHPDDHQSVIDAMQMHIEHGSKYDVEYRAINAAGNVRWMRSIGQVEKDMHGKPTIMRGIVQDITDQKNTEVSVQLHSTILKNISEGVFLIRTSDSTILFANPRFEEMFGYLPGEMIGKHVSTVNAPSDISPEEVAKKISAELNQHGVWNGEVLNIKKDRTPFWCYASVSTFDHPEYGRVWVSIHLDITEHKKADAEIRIAATVFESQEGMLVTDQNRLILRVNKAFTAITGYSLEDVVGQNPRILSSGRHKSDFYATLWESINTTGVWSGEIWNRRKDGSVYPEILSVTAVKDANGQITNYVATFADITKNKEAAAEIEHLAFYDSLTRLPNRRMLYDRLRHAFSASARNGKSGAILFIDLDNFKTLNDSQGHEIGDLLLQQVGERLKFCVREGDTVARLGGDEFVVLLEDLSENILEAGTQAESITNKILYTLNQPFSLNTHPYHGSSSIGISIFKDHDHDIEELLKQSDIAMYQAKKSGRNTLCFFDPKMQENINIRVALERDLREAIKESQFKLYYQIQVGDDGHVIGAEGLIRWLHPSRGLVSPDDFIPMAEETDLILPIGDWVLDRACAQISAWEKTSLTKSLKLSINVSAKQFRQSDFVDNVKAAVLRHDIRPHLLVLELTESLLLDDVENAVTVMLQLQDFGVRFSLDDFGTGYSSLQYLKRLPIHELKIDQSFVRDIVNDVHDRSIVQTIIGIAHSFEFDVIAEGVETDDQRKILQHRGCNHFQGYLFGKPVPIQEFELLLN